MSVKLDLEERILESYNIITKYDQRLSYVDDPRLEIKAREEIKYQHDLILDYLNRYMKIQSVLKFEIPFNIMEIMTLYYSIDQDRKIDETNNKPDDLIKKKYEISNNHVNPWKSGLFYLITFLLILISYVFIVKFLEDFQFILVISFALMSILVVGILQLRLDGRLKEESFVDLIKIFISELFKILNEFINKIMRK